MQVEKIREPTPEEIGELIVYLPILYAKGFSPTKKWNGGKQTDGTVIAPWPDYDESVTRFFKTSSQEQWCDYDYPLHNARQMLNDDKLMQRASISEIKTMLTFCVRGENFGEGFWAKMIKNGTIRKILERLDQIHSEMIIHK